VRNSRPGRPGETPFWILYKILVGCSGSEVQEPIGTIPFLKISLKINWHGRHGRHRIASELSVEF
jgi:hypothetical protein